MVEDNRGDVFLIRESIETASVAATLHVVQDGDKAIKFLERAGSDPDTPCPALVILDINLPKRSGRDVLQFMRINEHCAHVPVLIVTSSDSQRDRDDMARLGIHGYFRKPSEYDEFMKLGPLVKQTLTETGRHS